MQEGKYSIKQWAKDDRPREKLLGKGPSALSNSELIAILINNGSKQKVPWNWPGKCYDWGRITLINWANCR